MWGLFILFIYVNCVELSRRTFNNIDPNFFDSYIKNNKLIPALPQNKVEVSIVTDVKEFNLLNIYQINFLEKLRLSRQTFFIGNNKIINFKQGYILAKFGDINTIQFYFKDELIELDQDLLVSNSHNNRAVEIFERNELILIDRYNSEEIKVVVNYNNENNDIIDIASIKNYQYNDGVLLGIFDNEFGILSRKNNRECIEPINTLSLGYLDNIVKVYRERIDNQISYLKAQIKEFEFKAGVLSKSILDLKSRISKLEDELQITKNICKQKFTSIEQKDNELGNDCVKNKAEIEREYIEMLHQLQSALDNAIEQLNTETPIKTTALSEYVREQNSILTTYLQEAKESNAKNALKHELCTGDIIYLNTMLLSQNKRHVLSFSKNYGTLDYCGIFGSITRYFIFDKPNTSFSNDNSYMYLKKSLPEKYKIKILKSSLSFTTENNIQYASIEYPNSSNAFIDKTCLRLSNGGNIYLDIYTGNKKIEYSYNFQFYISHYRQLY